MTMFTRQISLAVVLGLAAFCAQAEEIRIGFINTDRIFKEANTAKQAQAKLEEMLPGRIIVQPFSWGWYFKTAKACKLYDFTRECWTDFQGHMTSPVRGNLPPKAS